MKIHNWFDVTPHYVTSNYAKPAYEEEICVERDCGCGLLRRRLILPHLIGSDHSSVKVRNTGEWQYVSPGDRRAGNRPLPR